jgi:fructose-1,6-bisphosphatase/sedoheptulose 1,7-bisphosphatase-like protein
VIGVNEHETLFHFLITALLALGGVVAKQLYVQDKKHIKAWGLISDGCIVVVASISIQLLASGIGLAWEIGAAAGGFLGVFGINALNGFVAKKLDIDKSDLHVDKNEKKNKKGA